MKKTFDPLERQREKQKSREEDEERIKKGEKVKNGFFSSLDIANAVVRRKR